jgi:hypothetical protein
MSSHRLRFFHLDEGIKLILLDHGDRFRLRRRVSQDPRMRRNSVGNRLMHDPQMPSDPSQIHPVCIEADGLLSHRIWIALCLRLWRVAPSAMLALKALTAGFRASDFDLTGVSLAVRTCFHPLTLSYMLSFSHSPFPVHLAES